MISPPDRTRSHPPEDTDRSAPVHRRPPRILRLPVGMADFAHRGFRVDRPENRALLEEHARSFLRGFNLAVSNWRYPHPALADLPDEERGFAYEGAAMHAGIRDLATFGRTRALHRLLAGPGAAYVHLIHVGVGWALAPLRIQLPVPVPATPLLRWLALDGAGFAECFFAGPARLRKACANPDDERRQARIAGCGRALWFIECADPDGIRHRISTVDERAQPHLWSGVGLASCYAGGVDAAGFRALREASGPHWADFGQGCLFGIAARARSGIVPEHTALGARTLFAADVESAAGWTDLAADGLDGSTAIAAYTEWKSRLRRAVLDNS
ncbi:DUF1702 family protein [Saccharopolyspora shandongensis]|uniref:DUF1702 family protein n=1 Tax=Saccharopolyspora shandongensis TaxID=418495 RepID=UPI0033F70017